MHSSFYCTNNFLLSYIELPHDPFPVAKDKLVRGLCKDVKLAVHFPGFPTLKHIPHVGALEKRGVRVFQAASRGDNLFLTLLPRNENKVCACQIMNNLLGAFYIVVFLLCV